ncbi:MAG: hypothetical protein DI539_28035 [Flavobacterium psychrophilum]|nr:MAG: hypothetical protein DI539_28035 [Flavobacterium psychrophilum]
MAAFEKKDLLFSNYKWTAYRSDDPKVTGKPDSTLLNRNEGYEMVYFINRYMIDKNWNEVRTGQKIEKYLKESDESNKSHAFWKADLDKNFSL